MANQLRKSKMQRGFLSALDSSYMCHQSLVSILSSFCGMLVIGPVLRGGINSPFATNSASLSSNAESSSSKERIPFVAGFSNAGAAIGGNIENPPAQQLFNRVAVTPPFHETPSGLARGEGIEKSAGMQSVARMKEAA